MPNTSPRVLVTPLNWGLGHATRCIPVIRELLNLQCEVIVGANGAAAHLLRAEFPELKHLNTPGKTIQYGRTKLGLLLSILLQLPALIFQLRKERKWIRDFVAKYQPHLIIADNRYGMQHKEVASILITHQLGIKTGLGRLSDRILQILLYHLVKDFNEIWVPDQKGEASLAGTLSNPKRMPANPVYYIGLLNRFANLSAELVPNISVKSTLQLLILLSGPEPQRSLLESLLKKQLVNYTGQVTILRGLPQKMDAVDTQASANKQLSLLYGKQNLEIIDHLPPEQLFEKIQQADIILCRSGYTSLMELIPLQKKLLLIPTPGQPEQEYLAIRCKENGLAISTTQNSLQLLELINVAKSFTVPSNEVSDYIATGLIQQRVRFYLRSLP